MQFMTQFHLKRKCNSWHSSTWNHVLLVWLLVYILNKFSLVLSGDCHNSSYIKKWKKNKSCDSDETREIKTLKFLFIFCLCLPLYHLLKTLNYFNEEIPPYKYPTSFSSEIFRKSLGIVEGKYWNTAILYHRLLVAAVTVSFFRTKLKVINLLMFLKKFCVAETALREIWFIL